MKDKKIKLAVLMGGLSAEREISFDSGKSILKHLNRKKYQIYPVEINPDLKFIGQLFDLRKKIDLAFIALHGPFGEDGKIQSLLEILGIPYTFSGVSASSLGMDKLVSRQLLEFNRISVPPYLAINRQEWRKNKNQIIKKITAKFSLPIVVKPNTSGSSYGVSLVHSKNKLASAIEQAFKYDELILVEKYLGNREISVPTLGNNLIKALPVIEIVPANEFFDLDAKYSGQSAEICPARLSFRLTRQAQTMAEKVHRILGARGLVRTDMMISDNKIYVLEANTIPGLTSESLVPKSARAVGINFSQLLDKIINLALES